MKKISFAIIAAVILISAVFAACGGADSGKVSDPAHTDPILTTLEEMVTEAMTDFENMLTNDMSDMSDGNLSGTASDTSLTTIA